MLFNNFENQPEKTMWNIFSLKLGVKKNTTMNQNILKVMCHHDDGVAVGDEQDMTSCRIAYN